MLLLMVHRRSIQYKGKKTSSVIDPWESQGSTPVGSFIILQFRKDISSGGRQGSHIHRGFIGSICQINSEDSSK